MVKITKNGTTKTTTKAVAKATNKTTKAVAQKLATTTKKVEKVKTLSQSQQYENNLKSKLVDNETLKAIKKGYAESNKNDTLSALADRFVIAVSKPKITNEELNRFRYFVNILVKDESEKEVINSIDPFTLKNKLKDIYNRCQKMGVIITSTETEKVYSYGMKHSTGLTYLKELFKCLLATKLVVKKPPKKEKAKKTTKK